MEKENTRLSNADEFKESLEIEKRSGQLAVKIKQEMLNHIVIKHRDVNTWYTKLKVDKGLLENELREVKRLVKSSDDKW